MTLIAGDDPRLTPASIRTLTADDLGVAPPAPTSVPAGGGPAGTPDPFADIELLADDDPLLPQVEDLLTTFGGVILTGPPGTSKSWYAHRLAAHLADRDPKRLRFVQFHPSYQYEDFVQGYVPNKDGSGFSMQPKHLVEMGELARKEYPDQTVVIVIDELSRGEPGRIFGEALTYVEKTKRGLSFHLASGDQWSIPENLVFIATMNPQDRGVDEVDAAFERRFAKIRMEPESELVSVFLADSGMAANLRGRVETFFKAASRLGEQNPHAQLGHTYFVGVADEDGLRRLWEHQLSFHYEKAYRLDPEGLANVRRLWDKVLASAPDEAAPATEPAEEGDSPEALGAPAPSPT